MTEREREIGARIREYRELIRWPQPAFAQEIGLSRDQLASIEYGRSPLRYQVGSDLCEVFDLNAEWLVTGNGPMHGGAPVLWVIEWDTETVKNKLFSEIYDRDPEIFKADVGGYRPLQKKPTPGFNPEAYLLKKVIQWFQRTKFRSPLEAELFARAVSDFAKRSIQATRRSGNATRKRISILQKEQAQAEKGLTDVSLKSKSDGVKFEIPNLMEAVKRKASSPGGKSALADELKVAPARISEWLSGKKEPGGKYTLKLAVWVGWLQPK